MRPMRVQDFAENMDSNPYRGTHSAAPYGVSTPRLSALHQC